jgi:hypothetical protein
LMSNLPYAQASIPFEFQRHIVQYNRARKHPAPSSSISATSFFITSCLGARRSATTSPLAKSICGCHSQINVSPRRLEDDDE